jgi:hypothetical protein
LNEKFLHISQKGQEILQGNKKPLTYSIRSQGALRFGDMDF